MKYTVGFVAFALCMICAFGQDTPPPPPELQVYSYESSHPLKRVARQDMPEIPEPDGMTPPPEIPDAPPMNRKRREAKGIGGSMPTRKG